MTDFDYEQYASDTNDLFEAKLETRDREIWADAGKMGKQLSIKVLFFVVPYVGFIWYSIFTAELTWWLEAVLGLSIPVAFFLGYGWVDSKLETYRKQSRALKDVREMWVDAKNEAWQKQDPF